MMATTSKDNVSDDILSLKEPSWRVKLTKVNNSPEQEKEILKDSVTSLQEQVMRLEEKISAISLNENMFSQSPPTEYNNLLDSKLIKYAQKRLRFDIKDVHSSIDSWNHFFRIYSVHSDIEKYFAVEQLLPIHIQRALRVYTDVEPSYMWLIDYLKSKYEPKYLCYEMHNKTVSRSTNINELEDSAAEAANCPREHIVKHFMLQALNNTVKNKMQHHILLPMRDFKLKMKMLIQEDSNRFHNVPTQHNFRNSPTHNTPSHQHFRNSPTQNTPTHHNFRNSTTQNPSTPHTFRNANQSSHRAINAINEVNEYVQERDETVSFGSAGNANA